MLSRLFKKIEGSFTPYSFSIFVNSQGPVKGCQPVVGKAGLYGSKVDLNKIFWKLFTHLMF